MVSFPVIVQLLNKNISVVDVQSTTRADEFVNAIRAIKIEQDTICNDAIYTAISTAIDTPAVQMYKVIFFQRYFS